MNQSLLESILLLAPFILGAVLIQVNPLPIRNFQAVYLLLGAAWLGIHSYFFPHLGMVAPVVILLLGEVFMFVMMGFIGTKLGHANYASLLVASGFFPWHLGLKTSLFYVLTAFLVATITAWVKFRWAAKSFDVKGNKTEVFKKKLSSEDYEAFTRRASVIFALPLALAAFIVVALTY